METAVSFLEAAVSILEFFVITATSQNAMSCTRFWRDSRNDIKIVSSQHIRKVSSATFIMCFTYLTTKTETVFVL